MKTKFRTPRKILSVFLCILMLTTSVVIANPFTASAAAVFDPSRYGNYSGNSQTYSYFAEHTGTAWNQTQWHAVLTWCAYAKFFGVSDIINSSSASTTHTDYSQSASGTIQMNSAAPDRDRTLAKVVINSPVVHTFYDYRSGVKNINPVWKLYSYRSGNESASTSILDNKPNAGETKSLTPSVQGRYETLYSNQHHIMVNITVPVKYTDTEIVI